MQIDKNQRLHFRNITQPGRADSNKLWRVMDPWDSQYVSFYNLFQISWSEDGGTLLFYLLCSYPWHCSKEVGKKMWDRNSPSYSCNDIISPVCTFWHMGHGLNSKSLHGFSFSGMRCLCSVKRVTVQWTSAWSLSEVLYRWHRWVSVGPSALEDGPSVAVND